MTSRIRFSVLAGALFLMLGMMGCQGQRETQLNPSRKIQGGKHGLLMLAPQASSFQVVDPLGRPVGFARIMIGWEPGVPFESNVLTADADGFWFAPEAWTEPLPVTIEVAGFVRATYFETDPAGGVLLQVRPKTILKPEYELGGVTSGFDVKNRDGLVDFSLTLPVVKPEDLFQFNLDMMLSPYMDSMSVLGRKMEVPSNISFPQQRESYILPLTIEKPTYRMAFAEPGVKHMVTIAGQFPIKPVFDAFRKGSSFSDVINDFSMLGISEHKVEVTQKRQRQDLPVYQNKLGNMRRVTAPVFNAQNEVLLAVSVASHPQGLYPVDVKRLNNNQVLPMKHHSADPFVLALVRSKSDFDGQTSSERLSASLEPWGLDGQSIELLPMMADPEVLSPLSLRVPLINLPGGYHQSGTLIKLSSIKPTRDAKGQVIGEERELVWEVYSSAWSDEVSMPKFPGLAMPQGLKRWSVSLFASKTSDVKVKSMKTLVEGEVTHVTHSNVDFE